MRPSGVEQRLHLHVIWVMDISEKWQFENGSDKTKKESERMGKWREQSGAHKMRHIEWSFLSTGARNILLRLIA